MSLNAYKQLVPDEIANGTAEPEETKGDDGPKKPVSIAKHSNFIVTINPNISTKKTPTPDARRTLGARLLQLNDAIKTQFSQGLLLNQRGAKSADWVCPPLESYQPSLEISSKNGWIHSHATVTFNGEVHINLAALRSFIKESYFPNGFHLDIKYYKDTAKIVNFYVNKMQGTTVQPAQPQPPQIQQAQQQQIQQPQPQQPQQPQEQMLPKGHGAWRHLIPGPKISKR